MCNQGFRNVAQTSANINDGYLGVECVPGEGGNQVRRGEAGEFGVVAHRAGECGGTGGHAGEGTEDWKVRGILQTPTLCIVNLE